MKSKRGIALALLALLTTLSTVPTVLAVDLGASDRARPRLCRAQEHRFLL
jgi:hypothetical protein